jgi:hypothetical protein
VAGAWVASAWLDTSSLDDKASMTFHKGDKDMDMEEAIENQSPPRPEKNTEMDLHHFRAYCVRPLPHPPLESSRLMLAMGTLEGADAEDTNPHHMMETPSLL